MKDHEFIEFIKELLLAPDTVIKKAHIARLVSMIIAYEQQIAALKKVLVNGVLKDHDACVIYQDEEYTKLEVKYNIQREALEYLKRILSEDTEAYRVCEETLRGEGIEKQEKS